MACDGSIWTNLKTPLGDQLRNAIADHDAASAIGFPVEPEIVVWCLLGPARLHYTLARGEVIPKAHVGQYLGCMFPQWADVAVQWRNNEPVLFTVGDVRAAADSIDAVVDHAWQRWADAADTNSHGLPWPSKPAAID
jgi:hypothetical protein